MRDKRSQFFFSFSTSISKIIGLAVLARLLILLTLPIEGLQGYGDTHHFFRLAELNGFPYIHYWSEFPPIFPFLSTILYYIAGGREHVYLYLFYLFMMCVDCGNLYLFWKILTILYGSDPPGDRAIVFLIVLISLPYFWWYFDTLAVFCMLGSIYLIFNRKNLGAGIILGIGILVKVFPVVTLATAYIQGGIRQVIRIIGVGFTIVIFTFGLFLLISPEFTQASMVSQFSKGSWETVWALIDGNRGTGNFGAWEERYDPSTARLRRGNPAIIPGWFVVGFGGLIGLFGLIKSEKRNLTGAIAASLFGLCLLFLVSPGWSVQWTIYLLPLVLLIFPLRQAVLLSVVMIFINVLEWPVLLSRGYFQILPFTIILRTVVLILMVVLCLTIMRGTKQPGGSGK